MKNKRMPLGILFLLFLIYKLMIVFMKKQLIRYFLEFLVIVLGISISFYLEKQNAINL
jgi:hypothetical protein